MCRNIIQSVDFLEQFAFEIVSKKSRSSVWKKLHSDKSDCDHNGVLAHRWSHTTRYSLSHGNGSSLNHEADSIESNE